MEPPEGNNDTIGRYRGALLGLAAGDAVGTALEFRRPGSFEPIQDMVGGGPFGLQPGQWTDDISMALCLAESLLACRGFDAADQMDHYTRWYQEGYLSSTAECFDIGNTVRTALDRYAATGDPMAGSTEYEGCHMDGRHPKGGARPANAGQARAWRPTHDGSEQSGSDGLEAVESRRTWRAWIRR